MTAAPRGFDVLWEFETALAQYTGAPYVVVTDCCTHALELCMRHDQVTATRLTAYTYVSVPQMLRQLGINFDFHEESWSGEYQFHGTRIWDSARRLEPQMYRPEAMQCLSFGHTKPLPLGRCGAVLLDDHEAYVWLSRARSDGRDLSIQPWQSQSIFTQGWHYCPALETCAQGIQGLTTVTAQCQTVTYPDCRTLQWQ